MKPRDGANGWSEREKAREKKSFANDAIVGIESVNHFISALCE